MNLAAAGGALKWFKSRLLTCYPRYVDYLLLVLFNGNIFKLKFVYSEGVKDFLSAFQGE